MQPDITATDPIRRLILHGASVRAAAQSARRAEFDVIGIDIFGDSDARAACKSFIRLATDGSGFDRTKLTTAINQLRRDWPDAMVIPVGDIGGEPKDKDPAFLARLADLANWNVPATLPRSEPPVPDRRYVSKATHSSGGLGVRWMTDKKTVQSDAIIQAFVPGRNFGATLIGNGTDCRVLGICRSHHTRIGSRPFVYAGSSGPGRCDDDTAASLQKLGKAFVDASRHCGLFNIDFVAPRDARPYVLEINPRWSASMELIDMARQSLGPTAQTLISDHVEAVRHRQLPPSVDLPIAGRIKRIVYANRDGMFNASRLATLVQNSRTHHATPRWADIPMDRDRVAAGQPLTTLFSLSPQYRDLYRATQACVTRGS